ncbi:hypothetical protein BGX20_010153 [Mortierella sp. AD010]|nr:hypothetical protein BGX20_010153 [Mortierella sp. AD010]
MDNLTISPVGNPRPCDNDINPSELARDHLAVPHVAINMEGPNHLSRSATVPPQNKTAPTLDTFTDSRRAASSLSDPSSNIRQTCKLKLHQQIGIGDQQQNRYKLNVKMEIRLRPDASPEAKATSSLSIHYFALYECSETKAQGLPTRVHKMHVHKTYVHKPYVWSIDVQHCENPDGPLQSLEISRYSISGDGTRVATLSATDDSLFLDLWDISGPEGSAPHSPNKSAWKQLPRSRDHTNTDLHTGIAVSWDASRIALFPTTEESSVKQLAVYVYDRESRELDSKPRKDLPKFKGEAKFHITDTNSPKLSNELFITCSNNSVDVYKVYGKWSHIFSFPVQPSESIYLESLTEMTKRHSRENFARKLIDSLQGKFFLSFSVIDSDLRPLVWDIEKHSLLVAVTEPINSAESPMLATFSTDQSILAILQDGSIRTYWTGSKTPIGKWTVPRYLYVSRLTFVRNNTQLLVECTDLKQRMGYILDPLTARVTLMDKNPIAKVLGPGEYTPEVKGRDRSKEDKKTVPQRLYTCHNSKLDFIQLDNIIYDPDNLNTQQCGQQICNDASLTLWTGETFESGSGLKFSYKSNASENSQEFKIPKYTDTSGLDSDNKHIHYKLSTFPLKISHGQQQRPLKIPIVTLATEPKDPTATEPKDPTATEPKDPTTIPNAVLKSIGPSNAQLATTITARSAAPKDTTVLFLRQKMLLILCSNVIITVWRLPEKYSEECTLLTARWIEAERFSSDTATKSVDERSSSDTTTKSVEECFSSDTITKSIDIKQYEQHQRLFIRDTEHVEHSLLAGLRGFPYDSHEHEFHFTVEGLVMMYIVADDECRKSIAQCLIESINRYQSPEGCVVLWIFKVFNKLSDVKSLELLEKLLTSVLGSEQPQWIPRPDFKWPDQRQPSRESISRILRLSKHSSKRSSKRSPRHEGFKSIELVEIIAPYCFRISREHKDIRLISPITACLPILWRHQHCEVALDLLRKLAYIPMNDGTQLNRIAASPISMRNVVDEFTLLVKETLSDIEESWEYIVENGWSFRQRFHHWFYKEICYQASDDEATAYKKKYFPEDELHEISSVIRDVRSFLKPTNAVSTEFNKGHQTQVPNMGVKQQREADTQISGNGNSSATPSDTQALLLQVQELRTQLTEKQSKLEKQLDEIRDLLRDAMPSKNG